MFGVHLLSGRFFLKRKSEYFFCPKYAVYCTCPYKHSTAVYSNWENHLRNCSYNNKQKQFFFTGKMYCYIYISKHCSTGTANQQSQKDSGTKASLLKSVIVFVATVCPYNSWMVSCSILQWSYGYAGVFNLVKMYWNKIFL